MSFQNENKATGFGTKGSKEIKTDFAQDAEDGVDRILAKGAQIAKENEGTIETVKKTALGCVISIAIATVSVIAGVIYLVYKIF